MAKRKARKKGIEKKKEGGKKKLVQWPIPAFLIIGIVIGLLIEQVAAGTLIGIIVGIAVACILSKQKK